MSLPKPIGKQREVLSLSEVGHFIILGTAGSGKTTLAIYRASYLAKLSREKVLLVTFNKALVTYLNSISDDTLNNVDVLNYHKFARGYLKSRGKIGWNEIVPSMDFSKENKKLVYIKEAIDEVIKEVGQNATLSRAPEVFQEEINWIERMGITTFEEYKESTRIGRGGTRVTRENREYFFKVYQKYIEVRTKNGYKYDWDDIARFVAEELEKDTTPRMYKHIIIDEGQDLSPVMLKSLALAIPKDGSLTFFGDVAQQIYGSRISWRDAGINARGNIRKFDQNYRNSKQIAELALAISQSDYFKNSTDLVVPKQPVASAPLPAIVKFNNEDKEIKWIIDTAKLLKGTQTVAILVRTRKDVKDLKSKLISNGVSSFQELKRDMGTWISKPGISIGTYHSAKGLEFDAVLLPYCNSNKFPDEEKIIALGDRKEALSEEIKLIYVAVTRAKRTLILTYTGDMTELIPENESLYVKKEMN